MQENMKSTDKSVSEQIDIILFNIGQEIKVHKLDEENLIIEIDYAKYNNEILNVFRNYLANPKL